MISVLIIPTGLGCEIGGHAGDANPVAKLIGACSDKVILHPNVVNASDINEMPANALYVEGSSLDSFLDGHTGLREVQHQNRILVAVNKPARADTINAVAAAIATVGITAEIVELTTPFRMVASFGKGGRATGDVFGVDELEEQLKDRSYDALAIHTPIEVHRDVALAYYRGGAGVNPWGGVEAKASRMIVERLGKPVAHAPLESVTPDDDELYRILDEVVDPRIAPEAISNCYLHCVLKGLNRAPRICRDGRGISSFDVGCLVSPAECWGRPHEACSRIGVPIIGVLNNHVQDGLQSYKQDSGMIHAENYLEAAGIIMAMRAGISRNSLMRPLHKVYVAEF